MQLVTFWGDLWVVRPQVTLRRTGRNGLWDFLTPKLNEWIKRSEVEVLWANYQLGLQLHFDKLRPTSSSSRYLQQQPDLPSCARTHAYTHRMGKLFLWLGLGFVLVNKLWRSPAGLFDVGVQSSRTPSTLCVSLCVLRLSDGDCVLSAWDAQHGSAFNS